jgi:DNA modification methylase
MAGNGGMKMRCLDEAHGDTWSLYHADCVDVARQMPDNSVDMAVYSPPFSGLYIYNDSEADMGNCANDAEFLEHYRFLVREMYRVMRPGRIVAVHCKDLVFYKNQRGTAGLRDFPGMLIREHEEAGFTFHSRVTIWRCPVREMTKTKAHGLLYKQLRADSSFSRQGLPEYFVVFRKWGTDADVARRDGWLAEAQKIRDGYTRHIAEEAVLAEIDRQLGRCPGVLPVEKRSADFPLPWWQEAASPVWMATRETDVLNAMRAPGDEKHICPMPLDLTERCIELWSNPGDVVWSPFAGIGSEGVVALRKRRKFIGTELKAEYFTQAARHLAEARRNVGDLFAAAAD